MSSTKGSEPVEPDPRNAPNLKHPEVLVAEIERTREDLARTLDLIADRVSPKRVADRTRTQVLEALAVAKGRVAEQAGVAREKATAAVAEAKDRAAVVSAGARNTVSGGSGQHAAVEGGSVAVPASSDLPFGTAPPAPSGPKPEVLAGGALGLLVLLLLRRRRTRRKAAKKGAVAALAVAGAELRSDFEKARKKGRRTR